MECRHFIIQGRVQGVFYRANTEKKARELNLKGWVRNCTDGSVECIACGEQNNLASFEEWLWQGPIAAKVSQVQSKKIDFKQFESFTIQ